MSLQHCTAINATSLLLLKDSSSNNFNRSCQKQWKNTNLKKPAKSVILQHVSQCFLASSDFCIRLSYGKPCLEIKLSSSFSANIRLFLKLTVTKSLLVVLFMPQHENILSGMCLLWLCDALYISTYVAVWCDGRKEVWPVDAFWVMSYDIDTIMRGRGMMHQNCNYFYNIVGFRTNVLLA